MRWTTIPIFLVKIVAAFLAFIIVAKVVAISILGISIILQIMGINISDRAAKDINGASEILGFIFGMTSAVKTYKKVLQPKPINPQQPKEFL